MTKVTKILALDAKTADAHACIDVERLSELEIVVDYTGDAVDSAVTMTVYSAMDKAGTVKALVGFNPILTATRDTDGALAFNENSSTTAYQVPGRHKFLYIGIGTITDDVVFTAWVIGREEFGL